MSAADLPGVPESAILVPVPEAEPVVGRLRARLDRSAGRGIPAHVTSFPEGLAYADLMGPPASPDSTAGALLAGMGYELPQAEQPGYPGIAQLARDLGLR